ncbi:hypothetical protein BTH42_31870 [Burkholderia sp. SRS-W-2-2016]|uniref:DNA-directed RNA polymerase subunit alpha C-terminal domain-containing protein n=1 Tax=Burkholderia sp. SRS-W-2-2016 TaxID=1926878 RepID=UPI00094AA717|nr:DNA-directed RNA polymerase subunit alpha C-terminal domain-containing protein [Burkholderia sp. SRS-W-2-2016]OLL27446.1 hypothetical protein BTH42_31870 [Burkholderia sp. SRS-W-2-2016]
MTNRLPVGDQMPTLPQGVSDENAARTAVLRPGDVIRRTRVADLPLSVRVRNALNTAGFHTVADLTIITQAELLRVPGIGLFSAKEVRTMVAELGLTRIIDLPLRTRVRNALRGAGIYLAIDLTVASEPDLLRIHGIGRRALGEIRAMLAQRGLSLKE